MKFKHLKTSSCPMCKCDTVIKEELDVFPSYSESEDRRVNTHCNGERWENREFLCGLIVGYVPNFRRDKIKRDCQRTQKAKNATKKKTKLRAQIAKLEKELRDIK